MSQAMAKKDFATELERYQGRLNLLSRKAEARGVSTILVFEGWDAAGKGGAIRGSPARSTRRSYQVDSDRRADRRRTGAPLSLALLASPVSGRAADDLRSQLVRPRAGRARRRASRRRRNGDARIRDQRVRRAARRARHRARQVLAAHHRRTSSCADSRSAAGDGTSSGSSPTRIGATGRSGPSTSAR